MQWLSLEAQRHSDTSGRVDGLSSLPRLHGACPADTSSFIADCSMLHAESRLCHKDDAVIVRAPWLPLLGSELSQLQGGV